MYRRGSDSLQNEDPVKTQPAGSATGFHVSTHAQKIESYKKICRKDSKSMGREPYSWEGQ